MDNGEAGKALNDFEAEGAAIPRHCFKLVAQMAGVIPFFALPTAVRKIIYPTNAIETLNRVIRKTTTTRGNFPIDDA